MLGILLLLQDPWWDDAWTLRRALTVRNGSDEALAAGRPVDLEIDLDFLGLRDKARAGLADLAVVRGKTRVPHVLRPGARPTLTFPLAAELKAGASDGYALYYGNPEGKPPAGPAFPLFQDFPDGATLEIGALTGGVRDGALEIRDVPVERSAAAPERIDFKTDGIPAAFTFSFELEAAFTNTPALNVAFEIFALDPTLKGVDLKPVRELAEQLGADDFEVRERATQALIALGPAVMAALADLAKAEDIEVRTRVERIAAAIRKASPPPVIRAGIACGEILWKTAAVGGAQSTQGAGRPADGSARRMRFEIARDPEGMVTISCDGQRLQRGKLIAPPGRLSLVAWKTGAVKPAQVRVDNLFLRPFVDPEDRPATTIDVEELKR